MRIPSATYRLQLGPSLRFANVRAIVPYLDALGVTDIYSSPIFQARTGSTHGYDVTDPTRLNPEIGTEEELGALAGDLGRRGLGLILDVVPNHMCIADPGNRWWTDVLENGPSSPYASYFDIDWRPPKEELWDKVLLPFLGDQYGRVLESQEIRIVYDAGAFFADFYGRRLPVAPRTWTAILEPALAAVRAATGLSDPHRLELESIITALGYLPRRSETGPGRVAERQREKEIVKRRLAALVEASAEIRRAIEATSAGLNGVRGDLRSFDRLEALLADQPYRLCYWRVAADEINYRSFFDINDLAATRVERPEVFAAVHELVFRWVGKGWVTGLRIDHVDGLHDPAHYLSSIRDGCRAAAGEARYTIVEKILGREERLEPTWPIHGTTGYDFLNRLNGLFIDCDTAPAFRSLYERFADRTRTFADIVNTSKKLIMLVSMAGEVRVLTWRLDRTSEQHRYSRDFTRESLRFALREVIASFPVYRSYIREADARVGPEDRRHVAAAIEDAKRRNPATSESLFDFVGGVLLLEDPHGLSDEARAERRQLVMRFQQLTGPVMAKGLEDTAFYRYFPLASLNEVGGDPEDAAVTVAEWHRWNRERLAAWPHSLSATTTHDTKRSEDVRARLNVLSEMPDGWHEAVRRWHERNRPHKAQVSGLGGLEAPDLNDEYLLYQTLVGAWPLEDAERPAFRARVKEYMTKAIREAKVHTSWIQPHAEYESAVLRFVDALLDDSAGNRFLEDFLAFERRVAFLGALNALAQLLLKIASPGVPDFYQGTELWTLTLVDPDNRRPVDFGRRAQLLAEIDGRAGEDRARLAVELLARWRDGLVKLYLTTTALRFRRANRELFESGDYVPLDAAGGTAQHVVAFLRRAGSAHALVAVPRFLAKLGTAEETLPGERTFGDGRLVLPADAPTRWRNVITGEQVDASAAALPGEPLELPLDALFRRFPVALLESGAAPAEARATGG